MFIVKIVIWLLFLKCSKQNTNIEKMKITNDNMQNDLDFMESIDQVQFIGLGPEENLYDPYDEKVSMCLERDNFVMKNLDLKDLQPENMVIIIEHFYNGLLKNKSFKKTFRKISFMAEKKQSLPPIETFHNFVVKFATHKDFRYERRISDFFVQSIAALSYELILKLSQTDLPKYIDDLWNEKWQEILQCINIRTTNYCYWKVDTLFNLPKLSKALDDLEKFSHTFRNALFFSNDYKIQGITKDPFISYYNDHLNNKSMIRLLE